MRLLLLAALAVALPAAAQTTVTVTTDADAGAGSLRAAIGAVNAAGGGRIAFAIPGDGVHVIELVSNLPDATVPVEIDGLTQPSASCGSGPLTVLVEIDGSQIDLNAQGEGAAGLVLRGGASVVRGVAVPAMAGSQSQGNGTSVEIFGDDNRVECSVIGLRADGTESEGTVNFSLIVRDSGNVVGGVGRGNVIGSSSAAVSGDGNRIEGNEIRASLQVSETGHTVGGTGDGEGNRILGGLLLNGSGHIVQGNEVGGTLSGGSESAGMVVGGTAPGARNVVGGISLDGEGWVVQGNYVGTDPAGTAVAEVSRGATIRGRGHLIGGTAPDEGNLIVGGVVIRGDENVVVGNEIGTDRTGTVALDEGGVEVAFGATGNVIGGTEPGAGNVITAAPFSFYGAIRIYGGSSANRVLGNWIGTDRSGTVDFGNRGIGVQVDDGSDNQIGSPEAPNVIAFADDAGVHVTGEATGNAVSGNLIYGIGGLFVDLDGFDPDGPTPSDAGDADEGPNRLQNAPAVTDASATDAAVAVTYAVDTAAANAAYPLRVEAVAVSPFGAVYLGHDEILESEAGDARDATFALGAPLDAGTSLVLIATDADGNTGESSAPVALTAPTAADDAPEAVPFAVAAWPNPAADRLAVTVVGAEGTTTRIHLLDALGRRVAKAEGARAELDVSGLAPGAYVVRAEAGGRVTTQMVTVAR
ncbi:T9SS type A sorting domain-containing protein [Rubrivirga marina]|uniref:Secretion system C-terminal sorting domain-containing protein n=1 Tax=Rubrivirga marina TaxID=1196024 RepID=A0A271IUP5_9BACT|nr:T9SS type A sorting domain-containing protein [Rubrivirga marina]PAP74971.1 hypothetical protein BSZ37_00155 [Rubrivirga marina]